MKKRRKDELTDREKDRIKNKAGYIKERERGRRRGVGDK